jgi:hypothetical protein
VGLGTTDYTPEAVSSMTVTPVTHDLIMPAQLGPKHPQRFRAVQIGASDRPLNQANASTSLYPALTPRLGATINRLMIAGVRHADAVIGPGDGLR